MADLKEINSDEIIKQIPVELTKNGKVIAVLVKPTEVPWGFFSMKHPPENKGG